MITLQRYQLRCPWCGYGEPCTISSTDNLTNTEFSVRCRGNKKGSRQTPCGKFYTVRGIDIQRFVIQ